MRVGLTVSIVAHAVILGFGIIAFPQAKPFVAEKIEALPVELVSLSEETDLLTGDEDSKLLPAEKPQPRPVVEAPLPTPKPEEEVAERPIEATPEPPPPPSEPEVVATLPEPVEEAALEPEPEVPVDPRVPRARPTPPKPVAEPKPEPPEELPPEVAQPEVAQPEEPPPEFNPDDIAALLNKQDPVGGGDPLPAAEPQTIGSIEGHSDAAMTQSEIAALKARLYRCWNPPVAVREAGAIVVEVRISLLPDGSLANPPAIVGVTQASDPLSLVAAESAIRAVVQCAPFGDILRPEKYALWRQIEFIFDPREMLGG